MGYHERTYTKVLRAFNGLDFRDVEGPYPRAILLSHQGDVTITDQYGNQARFGGNANTDVTRIMDGLQVAHVKTVHSGFAYLLW